jgi:2-oxoisovalerate ferredoxin oxidoreductase beta subunit
VAQYEVIHAKSPVFYETYERKSELQHQTHYCPGCGHGIAHKLVAEALEHMGLQDRAIFVSPVGCSVFAYYYFDVGNVQAAHGRTPAVATALKRANPQSIVIAYQGDGDLAAIGTAEIIHAANRGEKISVFFINNAIYGMTGGQMAPTTLVGQTSTTTPWGRRPSNEGFPLHVAELLATLEAPVYIERVALSDNKNIMRARKAVQKAIQLQRDGAGFSLVEILSPCPTIWKMTPVEAQKHLQEKMLPNFPLGVFRDRKEPLPAPSFEVPQRTVPEILGIAGHALESDAHAEQPTPPRAWNIKIAGFGGQGVLLLGQVLAEMGMRDAREVSWLPSYGPEMRSGSAHCHVCLAAERIGSPLIEHPDVLIAMNEISLRKFGPQVADGATILYNRDSLPEGFSAPQARVHCIPASDIADSLGATKAANMVMLGALLEITAGQPGASACGPGLREQTAVEVLAAAIRNSKLLEVDRQAIEAGRDTLRRARISSGPVG